MNLPLVKPNRHILVVDDNRSIHDDFRKILCAPDAADAALAAAEARFLGTPEAVSFEIDAASQGEEGLQMVERSLAEGRPYAEIVGLAEKTDADLIVIGTSVHASLFGGAPALGSEIERVVRNAPCPVLCVPSGRVVTPLPAFASAQPVPQT